jgi:hypothetical protein
VAGAVEVPDDLHPHVRHHMRRYYSGLAATYVAVGCSLVALLGPESVGAAVVYPVVFVLVDRWRWRYRRQRYVDEVAVKVALRAHRDPGPRLRPAADRESRQLVKDTVVLVGTALAIFGGLSLACTVSAIVRGHVWVALPAVPCVAVAAWFVTRARSTRAAARRWIDDPPPPRGEVAA